MKAKLILALTLLTMAFTGPALVPSSAAYADCNSSTSKKAAVEALGQAPGDPCNDSGVSKIVGAIVSILSYVVGIVAIIMVILSGFRYITSGGDSGKVSSAKNTLIYALIGIAVAVLAQLLVRFVVTQANSAGDGCSSGYHRRASDNKCVPD